MKRRTPILVLLAALAAAPAARAELFLIQEGADSSPYAFTPELPRGFRNTAYAFTNSLDGQDHSFEYYIRFDLPPELREPGVEVVAAYAWVYYGFDYVVFGDTTDEVGELLCHPVLESWQEATLTWNDRPAIGPWFDGWTDVTERGQLWCDVTDLVQEWVDGTRPNHGIALTSGELRVMGFWTWEDATVGPNFQPSLVVETLPEPAGGLVCGVLLLAWLHRRARRRLP